MVASFLTARGAGIARGRKEYSKFPACYKQSLCINKAIAVHNYPLCSPCLLRELRDTFFENQAPWLLERSNTEVTEESRRSRSFLDFDLYDLFDLLESRVKLLKCSSEELPIQMSIDFGCSDALVSQHFLHGTQVGAAFNEVGCKRMPEAVW
jgi:hypothetical protein